MKYKAFTLVELIVTIIILAILTTIAFISVQSYTENARDAKRYSDVRSLLSRISYEV
jgi:prepilin-type N-terminal cleavage/methylation domain-containing protein